MRTVMGVAMPIALGGGTNANVVCEEIRYRMPAKAAATRIRTSRNLRSLGISVRHRIDHVIHSNTNREARKLFGIMWSVGPLPRIAQIGVIGDGHHDPSLVVVDSPPMRSDGAVFGAFPQVRLSWN